MFSLLKYCLTMLLMFIECLHCMSINSILTFIAVFALEHQFNNNEQNENKELQNA